MAFASFEAIGTETARELLGPHPTPASATVMLANGPWAFFPLLVRYRLSSRPHPFTGTGVAATETG
jgi:hypothetical protein